MVFSVVVFVVIFGVFVYVEWDMRVGYVSVMYDIVCVIGNVVGKFCEFIVVVIGCVFGIVVLVGLILMFV